MRNTMTREFSTALILEKLSLFLLSEIHYKTEDVGNEHELGWMMSIEVDIASIVTNFAFAVMAVVTAILAIIAFRFDFSPFCKP